GLRRVLQDLACSRVDQERLGDRAADGWHTRLIGRHDRRFGHRQQGSRTDAAPRGRCRAPEWNRERQHRRSGDRQWARGRDSPEPRRSVRDTGLEMSDSSVSGAVSSGGPRNSEPGTLNQLFFRAVEQFDKPDALQVKRGGRYEPISHAALAQQVRRIALGLEESGVRAGDRVAILSENRPEWAVADYACLTLGIADVPIYPNLPPEQIACQLVDSACVAIFVSTAEQAAKVASVRGECAALKTVIAFDAGVSGDTTTFADLEAAGSRVDSAERSRAYRQRADAVRPDDLATIIYTSGTTGPPKGVMLTHDNLFANVEAGRAAVPFEGRDVMLSFLPLSHVLERMAGHFLAMATGTSIAYAESMDAVPQNLTEVRPTLVISVPRLYEKMYARVVEAASGGGAVKRRIFTWARGVSERWADVRLAGGRPRGLLALQYALAQRLVFSKLQARTGG